MTGPVPVVVIAEDDPRLRRVLQRALERERYRALSAARAETAYAVLVSEPADAVLLGVQLPTMSSLALYLAMVHRWLDLRGRIAIMTGDAEPAQVRGWPERNPCPVLRKPFDLQEAFDGRERVTTKPDRARANG